MGTVIFGREHMYSLQPLDGSYVHTVLMMPILGNSFVLYEKLLYPDYCIIG